MIPKIIHLIWFGGKDIPEKYLSYVDSWKRCMPDYEIKVWNEDSFDVNMTRFTKEAYAAKKWAFVSDFVRLYALSKYGGWYFDTDVEVVRSFDPFSEYQVVMSTDKGGYLESAVMGAVPNHPYFNRMVYFYKNLQFVKQDGSYNVEVINTYLQQILLEYGYEPVNKLQKLSNGIVLFTDDYFHVYSLVSGKLNRTDNTYSVHWHSLTWVSKKTKLIRFIRMKVLVPILGERRYIGIIRNIRKWIKK